MTSPGERVEFVCASRRLVGNLFMPKREVSQLLLFIHGLESNREGYLSRAALVAETLPAAILAFDLGGHGESEGTLKELTISDHLLEVETAYDWLTNSAITRPDSSRFGVCGASYGGYLSALLSARRDIWRLLLRAPAMYCDQDLFTPTNRLRSTSSGTHSLLKDSLSVFSGELLVLEMENDEVIPSSVIDYYLQICPAAQRRVMAQAGHILNSSECRAEFLRHIIDWFGAGEAPFSSPS